MKQIFKSKTNCYNILNALIFSKRNLKTDKAYRRCLIWVLRFGTLHRKSYCSEGIQDQTQNLK